MDVNIQNRDRKGSFNLPNSTVVSLLIGVTVGLIALGILLPLIYSLQGSSGCVGPYKAVASVMADLTGINLC